MMHPEHDDGIDDEADHRARMADEAGIDRLMRGEIDAYRGITLTDHWVAEQWRDVDYGLTLLARLADGQDVRPQIEQYVARMRQYLLSVVPA